MIPINLYINIIQSRFKIDFHIRIPLLIINLSSNINQIIDIIIIPLILQDKHSQIRIFIFIIFIEHFFIYLWDTKSNICFFSYSKFNECKVVLSLNKWEFVTLAKFADLNIGEISCHCLKINPECSIIFIFHTKPTS